MKMKIKKRKPAEDVRDWIETYYDVQGIRKAVANQIRSRTQRGIPPSSRSDEVLKQLVTTEKYINTAIKEEVSGIPIYEEFLKDIPGMGHILSAALVSWLDVHETKHASSFWKFAGLHVVDGIAPKRKKGEKLDWNPRVRALCWNIGESFIKKGNTYRDIYDATKRKYESKYLVLKGLTQLKKVTCPVCKKEKLSFLKTDGKKSFLDYHCSKCDKGFLTGKHLHNMAKRKMVKRFLVDLWVKWRELEKLPVTEPYVIAQLGHKKATAA